MASIISSLSTSSAAAAARGSTQAAKSPILRAAAKSKSRVICNVASPIKEETATWATNLHGPSKESLRAGLPQLVSKEDVVSLESLLDQGASVAALRRFNDNLRSIPADRWEAVLRPVFNELCFNLESFNPAFTSCLLMVQRSIGRSDYVRRDTALKNLIQPLAGEYGMHNGSEQLKTHRELFSDFFVSLFGYGLEDLFAEGKKPEAGEILFAQMSDDILNGGRGAYSDTLEKASYALGYNLAIEYLADYEKTWMLDSFRALDERIFSPLGKKVDWVFLEVHAEGEAEHAAIGHAAAINMVPVEHIAVMKQAMADHDRDFAVFYNKLADMMEQ